MEEGLEDKHEIKDECKGGGEVKDQVYDHRVENNNQFGGDNHYQVGKDLFIDKGL